MHTGSLLHLYYNCIVTHACEFAPLQFYVMEFAKGQIFLDPNLPSATPQQRTAVYTHMADTLAALHAVNPTAIGLQSYGNPNNYCQRQVGHAVM